ncbi:MAG: hypothetical protein IKT90_03175 [Clostridia bacterium]|nr:hypothetical protein [Clostridia bacterium]
MSSLSVRRIILLACLILIAISLALALLYTPPASPTLPAAQEQEISPLYTVKSYQDYVAVFSGNAELPLRVTGIRIALLPLQDQLDLADGIAVYSETDLSALLEDYGG